MFDKLFMRAKKSTSANPPTDTADIVDAHDGAAALGVKLGTFYALVSQGRLPPDAIIDYGPRFKRYDRAKLVRFREQHRGTAA